MTGENIGGTVENLNDLPTFAFRRVDWEYLMLDKSHLLGANSKRRSSSLFPLAPPPPPPPSPPTLVFLRSHAPGLQTEGSQASLSEKSLSIRDERLGSGISGMDWSDAELGSELGSEGMRDPSLGGKSTPWTTGSMAVAATDSQGVNAAGGARDIFDIPYKEQVGLVVWWIITLIPF